MREEPEKEPQQQQLEGAIVGSEGIPNNSQIIQQSPFKFRFKRSTNSKFTNSFPQLAFQDNIYYFKRKIIHKEYLYYA